MIARIYFVMVVCLSLTIFSVRADETNLTVGYATADFVAAKAAGFQFAEVRIREFMKLSDEGFSKFVADCKKTGLALTTSYWFLPNDMKVVGADIHTNELMAYFEKAFDRCQQLGVKFIVWGSGDSRRTPDGFSKDEAFQQLVSLGKRIAPLAQKRGLIIVAEPLRNQESNTINSGAEALKWVEAVNHPNFQMLVDIYHMNEVGEDAAIIVKAGSHIVHMHMSNPINRVMPLHTEEFNYTPFFKALNQIGYHGTMTIEASTKDLAKDGPQSIAFIHSAYTAAGEQLAKEKAAK
jgi:sugar phosphate isomerase/epimerase